MADINTLAHRMNYYNGLLLYEDDFKVEQQYFIDRRRRLNKTMGFGVVEGLEVNKAGDNSISVSAGTAIDKSGKECVQLLPVIDIAVPSDYVNTEYYVTIKYDEYLDGANDSRVREQPIFEAKRTRTGDEVILASFKTGENGEVPDNGVDPFEGAREYAGFEIADDSITTEHVKDGAITTAKIDSQTTNGFIRAFIVYNGVTGTVLTGFNAGTPSRDGRGRYVFNWTIDTSGIGPYFCTAHEGNRIIIKDSNPTNVSIEVHPPVPPTPPVLVDDIVHIMVASAV